MWSNASCFAQAPVTLWSRRHAHRSVRETRVTIPTRRTCHLAASKTARPGRTSVLACDGRSLTDGVQLLEACERGSSREIRAAMAASLDVAAANSYGRTALHLCARRGLAGLCRLLVLAGADLDRADALGCTPIYLAVLGESFRTVRVLLEAGADAGVACAEGMLPLCRAEQHLGRLRGRGMPMFSGIGRRRRVREAEAIALALERAASGRRGMTRTGVAESCAEWRGTADLRDSGYLGGDRYMPDSSFLSTDEQNEDSEITEIDPGHDIREHRKEHAWWDPFGMFGS